MFADTSPDHQDDQARYQAILDAAVEAIITIDGRGICESLNASAERMFGYAADELIGRNISILMPNPYRQEHDGYIAHYVETGEAKIIGIGREVVACRKNGEQFPIHLSVGEVKLTDRKLFIGIVQDITQKKLAEQRLLQSERLALLGGAMARLAHEGRNSLQRIQTAVETAQVVGGFGAGVADQLTAIERASDGLNALLEELRNFAAPLSLECLPTKLARVWRDAWQATAALRQEREAQLLEELPDEDVTSAVDRFRVGQVFRNLFENSLAACEGPLRVVIAVARHARSDGDDVWQISIRDNGPGLTAEQQQRVFEPFYTTKARGTGLGMSIAQRIVEAHGGRISVRAAEGPGAEFVLEMPCLADR